MLNRDVEECQHIIKVVREAWPINIDLLFDLVKVIWRNDFETFPW